jgi:hypothetical protein
MSTDSNWLFAIHADDAIGAFEYAEGVAQAVALAIGKLQESSGVHKVVHITMSDRVSSEDRHALRSAARVYNFVVD